MSRLCKTHLFTCSVILCVSIAVEAIVTLIVGDNCCSLCAVASHSWYCQHIQPLRGYYVCTDVWSTMK